VIVLEREFAGFGASGRNGGWVSGFFSGSPRVYARSGAGERLAALQRAMFETVEEVGGVLAREGIEADFVKSGQLSVAIGAAQATRLREQLAHVRRPELGVGAEDLMELTVGELEARVRIARASAATFTPHVARMHPAKLVRGLTD
jgi:glycine/D-amino acid oxidase-like deaminating enzyme